MVPGSTDPRVLDDPGEAYVQECTLKGSLRERETERLFELLNKRLYVCL